MRSRCFERDSEQFASDTYERRVIMIDIFHGETGAVIVTVVGERRKHYASLDSIDLRGKCLADADLQSELCRNG